MISITSTKSEKKNLLKSLDEAKKSFVEPEDFEDFLISCKLFLNPQSYGIKIQNRWRTDNGYEKVNSSLNLGDYKDGDMYVEFKVSYISTNNNWSIIQIRPHQKIQRYDIMLVDSDYKYNLYKIPKNKMDIFVDKYGEIRNDASDTLYNLRKSIQAVRTKVNTSFNSALSMYNSADYLDDIRETVMENRRVLAVKAMYRRKVKGSIMGASKTGSIVYIEPDTTQQHQRDLNNLEFEETEEVKRILLELTSFISGFSPLLESYQLFLTKLDIVYAKAKYAKSINAISPEITEHQEIDLVNAYHPLLLVANKNEGITPSIQQKRASDESLLQNGKSSCRWHCF